VDAFFPDEAEERREFTNSLRARWLRENQAFSVEVRGPLNDFTPNDFLLQTRGRQVQRLPEVSHFLIGQPLLGGALSYTAQTRAGLVKFEFTEPEARRFGFETPELAASAFGSLPDQSPADLLRARGFEEDAVGRFDTRHEISAPVKMGPLNAVPFVSGRVTAYSEDFGEFREANGFDEDDSVRFLGSAGVRTHTSIQKIDNDVESELLDLHGLRHIIEPSATLWTAATNVDAVTLPVFDERIESAAEGAAWRLGLRNTWQTKRGGPGRARCELRQRWR